MKLLILSAGKKHEAMYTEAIEEFSKRLSHYAPVEWRFVAPSDAKTEGEGFEKAFTTGDFVVLLDERGKELSSTELAGFLEKHQIAGDKRLVVIIGGAYGVSDAVKARAHFTLSLGKLIYPHQLVRLIIAEQLYRAFTIIKGEKYHHA